MSPKELLYIEDALGHEQIMQTQLQQALKQLQDPELRTSVQQMFQKRQNIFNQFYNLI